MLATPPDNPNTISSRSSMYCCVNRVEQLPGSGLIPPAQSHTGGASSNPVWVPTRHPCSPKAERKSLSYRRKSVFFMFPSFGGDESPMTAECWVQRLHDIRCDTTSLGCTGSVDHDRLEACTTALLDQCSQATQNGLA